MVHGKIINSNFTPNLRPIDEVLKEIKFDIKQFPGYGNINKKIKDLKKICDVGVGVFINNSKIEAKHVIYASVFFINQILE